MPYPFAAVENGTSVEIYHGNHGAVRDALAGDLVRALQARTTRAHLIAGYTCTPLVKFPVSSLAPGAKVMGTTIAELGNRNRPTDMIVYNKGGKDYLLIANTSRGVMKVATDGFATAPGITAKVATETGGVGFEPVASLKGVEQLDLLDDAARDRAGAHGGGALVAAGGGAAVVRQSMRNGAVVPGRAIAERESRAMLISRSSRSRLAAVSCALRSSSSCPRRMPPLSLTLRRIELDPQAQCRRSHGAAVRRSAQPLGKCRVDLKPNGRRCCGCR